MFAKQYLNIGNALPVANNDPGHDEDMRVLRKEQLEADCSDMTDEYSLDDDWTDIQF